MIDYENVDKLVENCKILYPDIPDYCLWVLACDYYFNESRVDDDEDEETKEKQEKKKEKDALEAFNKAQEEFKKPNMKILTPKEDFMG